MVKRDRLLNVCMFGSLVGFAVLGRWLSPRLDMNNFTPTAAAALFAGFFFASRTTALLVPLAVMVVSNLALPAYSSGPEQYAVYLAFLFPLTLRPLLRGPNVAWKVFPCAALCSIVFFVVTNFATCAWSPLYEHDLGRLGECYLNGLPFFRNTLSGDLFFSGVIFGAYALAHFWGFFPGDHRRIPVRVPKK